MTKQLFKELAQARDAARGERDLYQQQLEATTYRLLELIAGLKALNDMLLVRHPNKAQCQASENLVNRMVIQAFRAYESVKADDQAVCDLRKATGDE